MQYSWVAAAGALAFVVGSGTPAAAGDFGVSLHFGGYGPGVFLGHQSYGYGHDHGRHQGQGRAYRKYDYDYPRGYARHYYNYGRRYDDRQYRGHGGHDHRGHRHDRWSRCR